MAMIAAALRWLLGIFLGISAIGLLLAAPIVGLLMAAAALLAIPPIGHALGRKVPVFAKPRAQVLASICLFFAGLLLTPFLLGGTPSAQFGAEVAQLTSTKPAATELVRNFQSRLDEGNIAAALVVGKTLVRNHPDSAEAKAVEPQLAELQAKAEASREEAARVSKAKNDKEAAEAKATLARQFAALRRERDAVEGITFYYDRNVPMNSIANYFGLYLGVPDHGRPYLRWRFMYAGDDWLFIDSITFNVDGEKVGPIEFPYAAMERDNSAGRVWEWHDEALSSPEQALPFLRLASAKQVILRLQGKQYRHDRELSAREKAAMRKMLDVYAGVQRWGTPQ